MLCKKHYASKIKFRHLSLHQALENINWYLIIHSSSEVNTQLLAKHWL
jgi:hypothetical protein